MSLDIVFYAIIAAVLLARLWSAFGTRNDEDQKRPNPFAAPAPPSKEEEGLALDADNLVANRPSLKPLLAAPASLAGGLEQIKSLDSTFDEKQFLQGARMAFTSIMEDFARGDTGRISRLLGPNVLPHFEQAIEQRRKAGHVMENKIHRIRDAETAAAHVEDTKAVITVRFVSEQETVLRDSFGRIIGGEPGNIEEITDLWTFARDTKSTDPNWILVETRS